MAPVLLKDFPTSARGWEWDPLPFLLVSPPTKGFWVFAEVGPGFSIQSVLPAAAHSSANLWPQAAAALVQPQGLDCLAWQCLGSTMVPGAACSSYPRVRLDSGLVGDDGPGYAHTLTLTVLEKQKTTP